MNSKSELLPDFAPVAPHLHMEYELKPFTPVTPESSEEDTTASDLDMIQNKMAMLNASLGVIRTVDTLCKISHTMCQLIETRRKVKKLPFGEPRGGQQVRTFEVLS